MTETTTSISHANSSELNFTLTFGQATEAALAGRLVARKGWNGKNMFIFLRPADALPLEMLIERVKSLPQAVKDYYATKYPKVEMGTYKEGVFESAEQWPKTAVSFSQYWCMKAVDDSIVNGWLASQTDMLSADWGIVG